MCIYTMTLDGGRVQAAGPLSGEDIFLVYNVEQRETGIVLVKLYE